MKKKWKRWLAGVLTLVVISTCMAVPAAAADREGRSLIEQIQQDDLNGMTDDAIAHLVAWMTTNEPQSLFPQLSRTIINSPLGKVFDQHYDAEHFKVTSFDGTRLNCTLFRSPKGCERDGMKHVVISAHGYQVNSLVAAAQVPLFTDLGYDVVTFDQRQTGDSDHPKCTMGYNEGKDVGSIASWVRQKYGEDVVLGIYGHSMGAATVMMYSSHDPNLAFLIEDCGYASLKGTMKDIRDRYLKFVDFDNFYERAKRYANVNGVTYDDVEPIESVRNLNPDVPALFIHGENDHYINPNNVTELYNAKRGKKAIKTFKMADHDMSQLQFMTYNKTIQDFIHQNNL